MITTLLLPIYSRFETLDITGISTFLIDRFDGCGAAERVEIGEFFESLTIDRLRSLGNRFNHFVVTALLETMDDFGHVAVIFIRLWMRLISPDAVV